MALHLTASLDTGMYDCVGMTVTWGSGVNGSYKNGEHPILYYEAAVVDNTTGVQRQMRMWTMHTHLQ